MNDEFQELIESAVDAAFEQNLFLFKCYHYLKYNKVKRREIQEFIDSVSAKNLALTISDLDASLKVDVTMSINNSKKLTDTLVNLKHERFVTTYMTS